MVMIQLDPVSALAELYHIPATDPSLIILARAWIEAVTREESGSREGEVEEPVLTRQLPSDTNEQSTDQGTDRMTDRTVKAKALRFAFTTRLQAWFGDDIEDLDALVDGLMADIGYADRAQTQADGRDAVAFAVNRRVYQREYQRKRRAEAREGAPA